MPEKLTEHADPVIDESDDQPQKDGMCEKSKLLHDFPAHTLGIYPLISLYLNSLESRDSPFAPYPAVSE